jgi:hypothetical protein
LYCVFFQYRIKKGLIDALAIVELTDNYR